ncbi:hypothetical protein IQ238_07460 [Pleurocapsales cyanobacterium LEGE 06147]|nr:hypothetical protein [Pleurocapsales cyanobacterium LEGE 06147]
MFCRGDAPFALLRLRRAGVLRKRDFLFKSGYLVEKRSRFYNNALAKRTKVSKAIVSKVLST